MNTQLGVATEAPGRARVVRRAGRSPLLHEHGRGDCRDCLRWFRADLLSPAGISERFAADRLRHSRHGVHGVDRPARRADGVDFRPSHRGPSQAGRRRRRPRRADGDRRATWLRSRRHGAASRRPACRHRWFSSRCRFSIWSSSLCWLALALYYRRTPAAHKRLMLLSTIAILTAAVARLPGVLPYGPLMFFGLTNILVVAMLVYDRFTLGRVHPATIWGSLLFVLSQPLRFSSAAPTPG